MNPADEFQTIVCEHYAPLFRFAMSLTRIESDAQDLTQETFYVWATKGHQLRHISKARTWLYTTLYRIFLQARRRQIRFPHLDLDEVAQELPVVSPPPADQVDSSQVLSALARVDKIYQAAVALFYLDDCSYEDISVILQVPIGTVKSRIYRGIIQLRKFLLPKGARASLRRKDAIPRISFCDKPENVLPPCSVAPSVAEEEFEPERSPRWSINETEQCLTHL